MITERRDEREKGRMGDKESESPIRQNAFSLYHKYFSSAQPYFYF